MIFILTLISCYFNSSGTSAAFILLYRKTELYGFRGEQNKHSQLCPCRLSLQCTVQPLLPAKPDAGCYPRIAIFIDLVDIMACKVAGLQLSVFSQLRAHCAAPPRARDFLSRDVNPAGGTGCFLYLISPTHFPSLFFILIAVAHRKKKNVRTMQRTIHFGEGMHGCRQLGVTWAVPVTYQPWHPCHFP